MEPRTMIGPIIFKTFQQQHWILLYGWNLIGWGTFLVLLMRRSLMNKEGLYKTKRDKEKTSLMEGYLLKLQKQHFQKVIHTHGPLLDPWKILMRHQWRTSKIGSKITMAQIMQCSHSLVI